MSSRKTFSMTLDPDLMREAKKRAIDLEVPLYQYVEVAIRDALGDDSRPPQGKRQVHQNPESSRQETAGA